ncbi:Rieske (2Fe-2S) iron-sulphur domain protein [Nostocoides japonicum T1-X7]|uniref:Rieske (2Fe-2S) iron-sulphur domain protein n=1 Tax=Nostocoides japonicum T1-X7 TaxID=1194083 RepID=A0A077LUM4_9MICO|nr:aromatic ring-hydroxylating dioxygenase subunit alpha [Tetrasphaera japonica]CCH77241.1 Rieske (2Fe-2S) iron-sulphur domain protein [Tetrasphaera japonica T1-X7]
MYALDLEVIFGRHWLFCATEAEIPEPGDFVTVEVGSTSVIIVRDDDEGVSALLNVCRHRGSRIVDDPCGAVGNFVCPYHQWTYRTDGSLIFAESSQPGFDRSAFGLRRVPVRSLAGLVFVCLSDEPPVDFDEVAGVLEPYLAPYRLAGLKVAHQTDLMEAGNWKLVMENNRECLHCDAGHPELTSAYFPFLTSNPEDITPRLRPVYEEYLGAGAKLTEAGATRGIPSGARRELDSRPTGYQVTHMPLAGKGRSFGMGGAPVSAKLIGDVHDAVFGDMSVHFQPNSWFHLLSDHAIVFRALPVAPDRTLVRTTWLVSADAVEGVDYDVDRLTEVWTATNDEDRGFVERQQRGVSDPGYLPGPYATVEFDVEAFVTWYIRRLESHFGGGRDHLGLVPQTAAR